ncbi:DegT/DnrJ/EryC1/StrS family aminotransferase [Pectobacteriaceae bacterium C52]|uniref:DegT/DnrJ/EryC1/StrS family aminotransferase n=2 Tax=Enterobacterales TaxID=91347 RepID=UPI0028EA316E|nr:DegT/DnrJ/EryC1/StrS family aminotransferase [Brenneria ulupoensis]WJV64588.1 DegT/DnrJ/EryC1/StrS family aminotransferase [Pectobacteriaceae bacterium C52]
MKKISDKYLHHSVRDEEMILSILRDGQLSGTADIIGIYENTLSSYFGAKHAIAVSSGSTAIQAALWCAGVRPGDEILVPAPAVLPSLFPVTENGAIPVPVDVRENCLDFCPDSLRKSISSKTKAALIVPLWGYPFNQDETRKILAEHGIPLIEDCAHAHGAKFGNKFTGTFGDMSCFSTHDRKILATGEGGFVLTDCQETAQNLTTFTRLGNLSGKRSGVNYKLGALQAALGIARLPDIEEQVSIRRTNADAVKSRLKPGRPFDELSFGDGRPNYYNLVFKLNSDVSDPGTVLRRVNDAGIVIDQVKYGYNVFYKREVYSHISANCPNSENMIQRLIQIPVHPGITEQDIEQIANILNEI